MMDIVQAGDPLLRHKARALSVAEIKSPEIQQLIEAMRLTMYEAPGVGLAAPQVGVGLQLAVIEDREEYHHDVPKEQLAERERRPVPFQVMVNPVLRPTSEKLVEFGEGCLSVTGLVALVPRYHSVRVECLDEGGKPRVIEAYGWHARILQHEYDHLQGTLYIDRMRSRSLSTMENWTRFWKGKPTAEIRAALKA
jgi:peptide deformylase